MLVELFFLITFINRPVIFGYYLRQKVATFSTSFRSALYREFRTSLIWISAPKMK